ncbi:MULTISPECIES: GntR family transcriptional regulator [Planococcaceae]|uniref:GntR family transcriptional regulator n=1 Tax=Planococcus halotolerans TaxID=2233542 RepID=A0A365L1P2_9BACL|nr:MULTISPECIES: GntR family transcriptional regulator [Planococcaceae]RAZ79293.1 GntR family transcriptional regulator [Planococcus halotolerans]RLQ92745.1 GntR family transcriptional regulator [Planomicrobium sp. Y74]
MDRNNNRDPVYLQIIRYFKEKIAIGELQPGEEVPSRRELAHRMKVNPNTVQRAYKEMEQQGLIYTERNHPSKITTDINALGKVRDELIVEAVDNFVLSVRSINVPVEELLELVRAKYIVQDDEEVKA